MKWGSRILIFWLVVNALPGFFALISIATGHNAPALQMQFSAEELLRIDAKLVATLNGVAVIANALIIAFCILAAGVVFRLNTLADRYLLVALIICILLIQICAYWSDSFFGAKNYMIIHFSSAIYLIGLFSCFRSYKKHNQTSE